MTIPSVTIIVPCRNEAHYVHPFLVSVFAQQVEGYDIEVVIADGMSDDGTREKLKAMVQQDSRLHVIDNPQRNTPSALNRAIGIAKGDIIIRMDVHTEYSTDYILQCVRTLEQTGADNVGGPWRAEGRSYLQKAIALAFQSSFSSGGAGSHNLDYEGEVDSVYLGCWKKETLEKIGLFDEELVRNQDDELNLRLCRAGGKIWQSPKIVSCYYPRSSLPALFKQYSQYGYWKVRVIQKHKVPASLRHVVPGAFTFSMILFLLLSPFSTWFFSLFIFLTGSYMCANAAASVLTCRYNYARYLPVMPVIFAGFHFGYGYGFLRGVIDFIVLRKNSRSTAFEMITR